MGGWGLGGTPKGTLEYAPHDRYTGASNKQGILKMEFTYVHYCNYHLRTYIYR